jgi:ribosomal subunit interface protein
MRGRSLTAMDLTYTGRGLQVTDEMREAAAHKLGRLERLEPRATRLDLKIVNENHPAPDALKRIEASLYTPRKTFRAKAEASDVPTALDDVVERLERQLRDHHGKKRSSHRIGIGSAHPSPAPADTSE